MNGKALESSDESAYGRREKIQWLMQPFGNLSAYNASYRGTVINSIDSVVSEDFLTKTITLCSGYVDDYDTLVSSAPSAAKILVICLTKRRVKELQSVREKKSSSTTDGSFQFKSEFSKTQKIESTKYPRLITSMSMLQQLKGDNPSYKSAYALYDVVIFDCGLRRLLYNLYYLYSGARLKVKPGVNVVKFLLLITKKSLFTNDYYAPTTHHIEMLFSFLQSKNVGVINHCLIKENNRVVRRRFPKRVVICDSNSERLVCDPITTKFPCNKLYGKINSIVEKRIKNQLLMWLFDNKACCFEEDICYKLYQDLTESPSFKNGHLLPTVILCTNTKQAAQLQTLSTDILKSSFGDDSNATVKLNSIIRHNNNDSGGDDNRNNNNNNNDDAVEDELISSYSNNASSHRVVIETLNSATKLPKRIKNLFVFVDDRVSGHTSLYNVLQLMRKGCDCDVYIYAQHYTEKYEKRLNDSSLTRRRYDTKSGIAFINQQNIAEKRLLSMGNMYQRVLSLSLTYKWKDSTLPSICFNSSNGEVAKRVSTAVNAYLSALLTGCSYGEELPLAKEYSSVFLTELALNVYGITDRKLMFIFNGRLCNDVKGILRSLNNLLQVFDRPDNIFSRFINSLNFEEITNLMSLIRARKCHTNGLFNDEMRIKENITALQLKIKIFNYVKYFLNKRMWERINTYQELSDHMLDMLTFLQFPSDEKAIRKLYEKLPSEESEILSRDGDDDVECISSWFFSRKYPKYSSKYTNIALAIMLV